MKLLLRLASNDEHSVELSFGVNLVAPQSKHPKSIFMSDDAHRKTSPQQVWFRLLLVVGA